MSNNTYPDNESGLATSSAEQMGLIANIQNTFTAAIAAVYPEAQEVAVISRCGNPQFGDFQCNNAMSIAKTLREATDAKISPKDIAMTIVGGLRLFEGLLEPPTVAPNGFINIRIKSQTLANNLVEVVQAGVQAPVVQKQKVLVDFSSPNIAKTMHVGHLRSTIIGDSICRVFEFCGHDVARTNHVGDWGTQFGMLIAYLQESYPDVLTNPPSIASLTAIYKASKARFDADVVFKETARQNVVKLQSGDPACRAIWNLLCDLSRAEFQLVYDRLNVSLDEVGESFYNPLIPGVLDELVAAGLTEIEDGMLVLHNEGFKIPLLLRKSDGGYGYDTTDMAAMSYRLRDRGMDRIIIVTDIGQAEHFHMCFAAARRMGWLTTQRVDHVGFGLVQGDDGKRFKTRSTETVALAALLDEAKDRMKATLLERWVSSATALNVTASVAEGDSSAAAVDEVKHESEVEIDNANKEAAVNGREEELENAAKAIGYGAVKYFDLKQNPTSDYQFSYDRMLDTKGDTAVYLMFAYARLVSILNKAEERGVNLQELMATASVAVLDQTLTHPAERALSFELLQFQEVIRGILNDLLPNRLCEFLHNICVKATDFVTKCHVLGVPEQDARLLLCEATRKVMEKSFFLLGIEPLNRI